MIKLTKTQKDLLIQAERQKPLTIAQLAKLVKCPYRQVYRHIHQLAAMEHVQLKKVTINNCTVTLVVSNNLYYQRLLRLDDMYEAYIELSLKGIPH